MAVAREETQQQDRWNVEALYPNFTEWQRDFESSFPAHGDSLWPEMERFRGKLATSPALLKETLEFLFANGRKVEKLFTYAHLRHDEDIANDKHKAAYQKMMGVYHRFAQESSWFEPEILSMPQDVIATFMKDPQLEDYRFHLEKILRLKDHTLDAAQENLLALSAKALSASRKAFSAINDADFQFGSVPDAANQEREITHASYGLYIRDPDRTLRKNAFVKYHAKYSAYQNTMAELLSGQVEAHVFNARSRNYASCLEAALFPKNVDLNVYHALVQAVNDNLDALHRYIALRKRMLKLDEIHLYDMYVPLTSDIDIKMPIAQAEDAVVEAVAPLGPNYQNALRKGFKEDRWVDRFENKHKRSGAYSSGCYDSMPYILMNYKDILRDVFTLAHEAGHSMHSLLSHQNQPYHYADYPIFLAEVASTFNEDLLTRHLLQNSRSREEKIFLINQKIEDIRSTLFRQTMFAEFELQIHALAESNTPLTPSLLNEQFKQLNVKYFGPETTIDPEIAIEWARIPHFYYNFYVYQYATGISAAMALSQRVLEGGTKERDEYLSFLKGGCSRYPIELLIQAGVDMRQPEPVALAIAKFRGLVDELGELTGLALKETKC